MSINILQQKIREKKTPLALGLSPDLDKISPRVLKNFTDMYGDCPMAKAEALRYHSSQLLDGAAEKLPAVVLSADCYLRYGFMGFDVLSSLASAAKAKGLYVIVDCRSAAAQPWLEAIPFADGVTVSPYMGSDAVSAAEDKSVFAVVRSANASSGDVQNLMSGDRRLYVAAAEQMSRHGAAIMMETGYSLDIKELRRKLDKTFLLLKNCDGENGIYAFDDYGHGGMIVDDAIQYADDPMGAMDEAVKDLKQWIIVA